MRAAVVLLVAVLAAGVLDAPHADPLTPAQFAEQLRSAQQYVRRGQLGQAIRIYEALWREAPGDERLQRNYAAVLRQAGRFEDALDVYARADHGQSRPRFLVERVTLLKQLERRDEALDLCLANLNAPLALSRFVQDELLTLASADSILWRRAYDELRLRNEERTTTEAVSMALAEVCLQGEKYDEAVEVTRRLDRSMGARGSRLLAVAKRLEALGQDALALDVVRDVVPDLDDPLRRDAAIFRAGLEERLGHPDEAYAGLTWLAAHEPNDQHVYEVHLERARLLAGPLNHPDHAIAIYDTLLADGRLAALHERVRLARAETQLVLERFDGALADCRELAATSRKESVRERAAFMVGEIFFFQGEIDSAAAAYGRQVEAFPTGLLANDGLDRIFLFNENYDTDGSALVAMGKLHELASRGELDAALDLGDSLATRFAMAPIHDDLLYEIASLAVRADQPKRALVRLDVISTKYQESRLAPRALELEGEILEERMQDPGAALATYEDLLIRYPLSIEASEVRPRVTRLRQEVRS